MRNMQTCNRVMAQHYGRNAPVQERVPGVDEALRRIMAEHDVTASEAVGIYLAESDAALLRPARCEAAR